MTKDELDDSILGTARIDPSDYSAKPPNRDRLKSLKYAIAGLIYMFRREQSTQALTGATVTVVLLLLWLEIDRVAAAVLLTCVGMVWVAEILNSAVEAVVDLATDEIHPMAKVAKDVASAAALVGTLLLVAVAILILGPSLADKVLE